MNRNFFPEFYFASFHCEQAMPSRQIVNASSVNLSQNLGYLNFQQCTEAGSYQLSRADYKIFRKAESLLILSQQPEIGYGRIIYTMKIGKCERSVSLSPKMVVKHVPGTPLANTDSLPKLRGETNFFPYFSDEQQEYKRNLCLKPFQNKKFQRSSFDMIQDDPIHAPGPADTGRTHGPP